MGAVRMQKAVPADAVRLDCARLTRAVRRARFSWGVCSRGIFCCSVALRENCVLHERRTQPGFFMVLSRISEVSSAAFVDLPISVDYERTIDSGNSIFIKHVGRFIFKFKCSDDGHALADREDDLGAGKPVAGAVEAISHLSIKNIKQTGSSRVTNPPNSFGASNTSHFRLSIVFRTGSSASISRPMCRSVGTTIRNAFSTTALRICSYGTSCSGL